MKPTLQVRLSQHLALTPQLQQSIRLLQLSTLELAQEVEQMLEQNPFLEIQEEPLVDAPAYEHVVADEHRAESDITEARSDDTGDPDDGAREIDSIGFDAIEPADWGGATDRMDFDEIAEAPGVRARAADLDEVEPQDHIGAPESLQEHLRGQLSGVRLSPQDAGALAVLIDSLDEDGYLRDSLEEVAERLTGGDDMLRQALLERLQFALKWLQSLEPLGVGACSLSECLTLQLRRLPPSPAQMIAILICKQHLDLLARRDSKRLIAATGADEELLRQAQALIVGLEPKPGRRFARTDNHMIVPDVIVKQLGRVWKAVINPEVIPKLRINDFYATAIRDSRGSSSTPLGARLQEARWLVRNIAQRFDTIERVAQAIVERQRSFFTHGAIAMKPLVLREIADALGMHESTISRVTNAKYMSTPFGTFELKYFFGSSLSTDAGGSASSTAVRVLISQLVAAEDSTQPLSDSTLSLMLDEQGIKVARRTVAKYREALKIAPAKLRRSL